MTIRTSQDAIHQDDELGNKGTRDRKVGGASRPFFVCNCWRLPFEPSLHEVKMRQTFFGPRITKNPREVEF
jgi:hypothetical protein